YTVQAVEALAEFEKLQSADKSALHELLRIGVVQDGKPQSRIEKLIPRSIFGNSNLTSHCWALSLTAVRPECFGILRNLPQVEGSVTLPKHSPSPYFMNDTDVEKYFKKGFAEHFGHASFGKNNEAMPFVTSLRITRRG
ncbi:hypothetical protein BDFB_013449, partial [Asbolus verrucosus]